LLLLASEKRMSLQCRACFEPSCLAPFTPQFKPTKQ
jgi:hypothetical protein